MFKYSNHVKLNKMTNTKARTKEAVAQQLSVMTALIGTQTASYLVPNYNDGQKLAIVDEGVLKFLKSLLPKASTSEIIRDLIDRLEHIKYNGDLQLAVNECKDFVAFHETVNLMKRYFDPNTKVEYEEPFNQEPKPLTFVELLREREKLEEMAKALDKEIAEHPDRPQPIVQEKVVVVDKRRAE